MPIATIISGLLSATGTIAGGLMSASAVREANLKNLELAERERADTLKQRNIENVRADKAFSLARQQFEFGKEESALNREERKEQTSYDRLQHAADMYAQFRNDKQALLRNKLSPLMGRG